MTQEQWTIVAILTATMAMFLWGRWRHDMVAGGALLACVFTGLLPAAEAFTGFSHPAVITVACVLVLSQGLQISGAVNFLTRRVTPLAKGPRSSIFVLTTLAALLSGFINNIGALALLMPRARVATLDMPVLILPSLQVNMRAGHLPLAEDNNQIYFKVPVNAL